MGYTILLLKTRFDTIVQLFVCSNSQKLYINVIKGAYGIMTEPDFNRFRDLLSNADWTCILDEPDINKAVELFNDNLIHIAENSIPNKIPTIRQNDYPWINDMIRKLIRKRKRLHRKAKKNND